MSAKRDAKVGVLPFLCRYTKLLHCWLLVMSLACNTEFNMTVLWEPSESMDLTTS